MVNILRLQGIEIGRATGEVKLKEGTFPAGSFVIKRDQPYGRLAKILLEKQDLPRPEPHHLRRHRLDHGPDVPRQSGRDRRREYSRVPAATLIENSKRTALSPAARRPCYAVLENGSNNLVTLRYRLKDVAVRAVEQPFKSAIRRSPPDRSFSPPALMKS